jgi:AraC-like DNA-binding protein/DNA gyrase inhibitor GyrI
MSHINNANFVKAVRFIYDNIDQPFVLEDISNKVGVSLSSLKRLFAQAIDKTPGEFTRRLRMELAFCSLQTRNNSVLEVALSAGFDDQSAFARRFKETFGYSPTEARKKLNIVSEFECVTLEEPDIVELNDLAIQAVTEQGLYFESAPRAWDFLRKKLFDEQLGDDFSGLFIGIGHDNPHDGEVAQDQVRYTAGVALLGQELGVEHRTIRGGSYARFHYLGKPVNLGLAYHYIYGKWSEGSMFEINTKIPAFVAFSRFPESFQEEKLLIHVPLIV